MLADIAEIRMLRKSHNLTQSQLARLAGVSQSFVAKVEAGVIDPGYRNFRKMHEVLTSLKEKRQPKAADFMSRKLISVGKKTPLPEAIRKMKHHNISQLPVTDGKSSIAGLVSEADVIEAVRQGKDVRALKATDIMSNSPPSVPMETPLKLVTDLLRISPLVVITDKGKAKGAVTKADVLGSLGR